MKRVITVLLSAILILNTFGFYAAAAMDWDERQAAFAAYLETLPITVCINGDNVDFGDAQPRMIDDRNMVPMRALFEAMGAKVDFDQQQNNVTVTRGDTTLRFAPEGNVIQKTEGPSQQELECDVPFSMLDDRVYAPARFACQALGAVVDWDNDSRRVLVLDKGSFQNSIKDAAPAFYAFLDMPIFKVADSSVSHNQKVSVVLKGIDKENLDSQYDLTLSEYIDIRDGKVQANATMDLEIDALFEFFSYAAAILQVDMEKLNDVTLDVLMDDTAIYVKTNLWKAFKTSPINKNRGEAVWFRFELPENSPIAAMLNDEESSLLDLLNGLLFPSWDNDDWYDSVRNRMSNARFISTLIKHCATNEFFVFNRTDNANYSISWNPTTASFTNAVKEHRAWLKPFLFNPGLYYYFDWETDTFDLNKKPNMELTPEELQGIDDFTHQISIDFAVQDAAISLFNMDYTMTRANYKDGWNVLFKFEADSKDEPVRNSMPIVMPDSKSVIDFDDLYDLMLFPSAALENNLLKIFDRYAYDYYYFSYEN